MAHSSSSFLARLYSSFVATYGPVFTLLSVLFGVASFYVIPETSKIETRTFLLVLAAFTYLLLVISHAAFSAHTQAGTVLPSVRYASKPPAAYRTGHALLILEESKLFGYDTLVSVYRIDDEVEELIGIGKVVNVQLNGRIQVLIQSTLGHQGDWAEVTANNVSRLRQLIVKPNVPAYAMEEIAGE